MGIIEMLEHQGKLILASDTFFLGCISFFVRKIEKLVMTNLC